MYLVQTRVSCRLNVYSVSNTEMCFEICPLSMLQQWESFWVLCDSMILCQACPPSCAGSQDYLFDVSGLLPWWRRRVKTVAATTREHTRKAVLIPYKSSCKLYGLVLPHCDSHRVGWHAQRDKWGNIGRCVTSDGVSHFVAFKKVHTVSWNRLAGSWKIILKKSENSWGMAQ